MTIEVLKKAIRGFINEYIDQDGHRLGSSLVLDKQVSEQLEQLAAKIRTDVYLATSPEALAAILQDGLAQLYRIKGETKNFGAFEVFMQKIVSECQKDPALKTLIEPIAAYFSDMKLIEAKRHQEKSLVATKALSFDPEITKLFFEQAQEFDFSKKQSYAKAILYSPTLEEFQQNTRLFINHIKEEKTRSESLYNRLTGTDVTYTQKDLEVLQTAYQQCHDKITRKQSLELAAIEIPIAEVEVTKITDDDFLNGYIQAVVTAAIKRYESVSTSVFKRAEKTLAAQEAILYLESFKPHCTAQQLAVLEKLTQKKYPTIFKYSYEGSFAVAEIANVTEKVKNFEQDHTMATATFSSLPALEARIVASGDKSAAEKSAILTDLVAYFSAEEEIKEAKEALKSGLTYQDGSSIVTFISLAHSLVENVEMGEKKDFKKPFLIENITEFILQNGNAKQVALLTTYLKNNYPNNSKDEEMSGFQQVTSGSGIFLVKPDKKNYWQDIITQQTPVKAAALTELMQQLSVLEVRRIHYTQDYREKTRNTSSDNDRLDFAIYSGEHSKKKNSLVEGFCNDPKNAHFSDTEKYQYKRSIIGVYPQRYQKDILDNLGKVNKEVLKDSINTYQKLQSDPSDDATQQAVKKLFNDLLIYSLELPKANEKRKKPVETLLAETLTLINKGYIAPWDMIALRGNMQAAMADIKKDYIFLSPRGSQLYCALEDNGKLFQPIIEKALKDPATGEKRLKDKIERDIKRLEKFEDFKDLIFETEKILVEIQSFDANFKKNSIQLTSDFLKVAAGELVEQLNKHKVDYYLERNDGSTSPEKMTAQEVIAFKQCFAKDHEELFIYLDSLDESSAAMKNYILGIFNPANNVIDNIVLNQDFTPAYVQKIAIAYEQADPYYHEKLTAMLANVQRNMNHITDDINNIPTSGNVFNRFEVILLLEEYLKNSVSPIKIFTAIDAKLPDEFSVETMAALRSKLEQCYLDFKRDLDQQLLAFASGTLNHDEVETLKELVTRTKVPEQFAQYTTLTGIVASIDAMHQQNNGLIANPAAVNVQGNLSFLQVPAELPLAPTLSASVDDDKAHKTYLADIARITREREHFTQGLQAFNEVPLQERYALKAIDFIKQHALPPELQQDFLAIQLSLAAKKEVVADFIHLMDKLAPSLAKEPDFTQLQVLLATQQDASVKLPLAKDESIGERTGFIVEALKQALTTDDLAPNQRLFLFQEACVLMEALARDKHPAINDAFIQQIVAIFKAEGVALSSLNADEKVDSRLVALTTAVLNQLKETLPPKHSEAATASSQACRQALNEAIQNLVTEVKSNQGPSMRASVVVDSAKNKAWSPFRASSASVTHAMKIAVVDATDSLVNLVEKIQALAPVKMVGFSDVGSAKPATEEFRAAKKNNNYIINDFAVSYSASASFTPAPIGKRVEVEKIRHQLTVIANDKSLSTAEVQKQSLAAIQFYTGHDTLKTDIKALLVEIADIANDFPTLKTTDQDFFLNDVIGALNKQLATSGLPPLTTDNPATLVRQADRLIKYMALDTSLQQAMYDVQAYDQLNGGKPHDLLKNTLALKLNDHVERFLSAAKLSLVSGQAIPSDLVTAMASLQNELMLALQAVKKPSTNFMQVLDKANAAIHQALLAYEVRPQETLENKKITALQEGLNNAIGKLQRYPRLEDTSADNQTKRQFFNDFRAELQTVSLLLLTSPAEGEARLADLDDKIAALEKKGLKDSGTQFKDRLDIAKGMVVDAVNTYQIYAAERTKEQGVRAELVSEISEILTLFESSALEGEQRLLALPDKIAVWEKACPTDAIKKLLEPCQPIIKAAQIAQQSVQTTVIETPAVAAMVNDLDVLVRRARTDSSESVLIQADCMVEPRKASDLFAADVQVLTGKEAITTGRESIAMPVRPESIDLSVESRSDIAVVAKALHETERTMAPVKSLTILLATLSNGLGNSHSGPGRGPSLTEEAVKEVRSDNVRTLGIRTNRVMAFLGLKPLLQKLSGFGAVYCSCAAIPYLLEGVRLLRMMLV